MTRRRRTRLVEPVPRVFVGPSATRALRGEAGVLLGEKRVRQVDVLEFEPCPGPRDSLRDRRFDGFDDWDAVGVSLPFADFRRVRGRWLDELVPGDVLLTEDGALVHVGDDWVPTRIVAGGAGAT